MNLLCIDIGNSTISMAESKDGKFGEISRFKSDKDPSLYIKKFDVENIAMASVVPEISGQYSKYSRNVLGINPFEINYKNSGIEFNLKQPSELGNDRICNIAAAVQKNRFPAIIIDFGTATTYDVVNELGVFIGGAIAPGIDTSAQNLINRAVQLTNTELKFPKNVISTNTKTNIQSGVMFGGLESVNGMIRRIIKELNIKKMDVILTGGFGEIMSEMLDIEHIYEPLLTLQGIESIFIRNRRE